MHGITHLLSHHGSSSHNHEAKGSTNEANQKNKNYNADVKLIAELAGLQKTSNEGKLYLNDRQASRGSVSSTYSYGSSYGSSHGSPSSNNGSGYPLHQSVYHTIHGSGNHSSSGHYHHPLQTFHQATNLHNYSNHHHQYHHHHHHQQQQQQQQLLHPNRNLQHSNTGFTSRTASPTTSTSPTGEPDKQHHHHHSIHEMIRYFGRRLGHIRRQSECQDTPREKEEEFRNRSQSLDGASKPPILEPDCETTYRIYESILRQGNQCVQFSFHLPAVSSYY